MDLDEQITIWKILKEQQITIAECIAKLDIRSGKDQKDQKDQIERDKLLRVLKKNEFSHEFNMEIILKWLRQIASAIDFLHNYNGKKIIHCDIKPKNIFILKGEIKLGDFGISKSCERDSDEDFTERNIGTEGYQAPELVVDIKEKTNESVDIWF
jgi:serine/threonine protein kinase